MSGLAAPHGPRRTDPHRAVSRDNPHRADPHADPRETFSSRLELALFGALLRIYPGRMRTEHGSEMREVFADMRDEIRDRGVLARMRLWTRIMGDLARSAPAERWREHRRALRSATRPATTPDWRGAVVAGVGVLVLYVVTLAPTTAFWDAGGYITVAHVLGIPHPPGNPLFVMIARAWDVLLSPTGWPTAVRINLFSAACSAIAHAFLFLIIARSLEPCGRLMSRLGAVCAVLLSATAFTVWHQSNVNEKVYTLSLLTTMMVLWLAVRWRDTRNTRLLVLAAYITALSATNHLMGVLVAPAAAVFVWRVDRAMFLNRRLWATALPAALLALSAQLFLPLRAAERPVVNEPDPVCESLGDAAVSIYTNGARGCDALSATLTREQYAKPSILSDPNFPTRPRGASLLLSQFVNYAQYFDWQWARSVDGRMPMFGGTQLGPDVRISMRPFITALIILLIAVGAHTHWRTDHDAALMHGVAVLMLSFALVLYLNFAWGYSIQRDAFPDPSMHEVRERDYFFLIGFSLWGAWAGLGIAASWRTLASRIEGCLSKRSPISPTSPHLPLAAPLLALAIVPLLLNWNWASRSQDWTARDWAYNVLMSVEPYGVLVTNGDNDSFPLWYIQHVEHVREDVTVVLSPYLAFPWYARQIRDMSRACTTSIDPSLDRTRITCQRPFDPDSIHPRLLAAWGDTPDRPPEDSVLPFGDADIDRMAESWFVTDREYDFRVGNLESTIPAGTTITPVDTFVAAIVRSTWGERPIHFMTPSSPVARLGLDGHTVRIGLTWKLREPDDGDLTVMPDAERGAIGAWLDRALTDTLARHVFIHRGRLTDSRRPWVDHANYSIPAQYAMMHYAAVRGAEVAGNAGDADWHMRWLEWWNSL